jgi:uncharacterized protein (TIGR02246 family)
MMTLANLSLEDRQAIRDLLNRYLWCMDTHDVEGFASIFTPDGAVKAINGRRWDGPDGPRGFASQYLTRPDRPASQHWGQELFVEEGPDSAYTVTSYCYVVTEADGQRTIGPLGYYADIVVKVDGRWRFKEKVIEPWTQEAIGVFASRAAAETKAST